MDYRVAEYNTYKELGGKGDWSSGILKIHLSSWNEYHDVIAKLLDLGDFIWRGQEHDWPLISRFDRVVTYDRKERLRNHLEAFLRAIQGRRGNNPPKLDKPEEIWSLGRHYGLATPLLDWTESPFVAAYFAFNQSVGASTRFIYGLSEDIRRWGPSRSKGDEPYDHFIKFVRTDSDENPRLFSQRGLYTEPLSADIEIEKIVELCYAEDVRKGVSRIIFVKIQIPQLERENCLRNLNRMNINHATLFPDLIGSAEYCNLKLEIKNYS
jgi:hypothetical protein